jgi:hypothetical protein
VAKGKSSGKPPATPVATQAWVRNYVMGYDRGKAAARADRMGGVPRPRMGTAMGRPKPPARPR